MKLNGHVAEWLRRGLQILVSQFDSGRGLQKINLVLIKKKSKLSFLYSSVAQLVEQLTVNQLVAGSSRGRGANKYLINQFFLKFLYFLILVKSFPFVDLINL